MQTRFPEHKSTLALDILAGILAGIAGTYAITKLTPQLQKLQPARDREKEHALLGESSTMTLARRIDRMLALGLDEQWLGKLATAIHWGYGTSWGALFGVLHDRVPRLASLGGVPFALGFFAIGDEAVPPAFGLTPAPTKLPLSMHIRDLFGHLGYTLAADQVFHLVRKASA